MKFHLEISILLISILGLNLNAQDLNRKNLIEQLKAEKESIFVINGNAFLIADSLKLDKELSSIQTKKIADITIFKDDGKLSHPMKNFIIINYATKLKSNLIKKKWKEIKPKFSDEYYGFSSHIYTESKDSVLYINGYKIHHTEVKNVIKNFKINNIGYIYYSQSPVNSEYYGQNAKNGLVIIWSKEKLK